MDTQERPNSRGIGFGNRVRAARAYAGGISQTELARRIQERFPGADVSSRTIKRVEAEDASVRGTMEQWSEWVGSVTETPVDFLVHGFDPIDPYAAMGKHWEAFNHFDWLEIGGRALWFAKSKGAPIGVQRALVRRLWREGGVPFAQHELRDPTAALFMMSLMKRRHEAWIYEKISTLLRDAGVPHAESNDGLSGLLAPGEDPRIELVRGFVEGENLNEEELRPVRNLLRYLVRMELDPYPGVPEGVIKADKEGRVHPSAVLLKRMLSGDDLDSNEQAQLRLALREVLQAPNTLDIDWPYFLGADDADDQPWATLAHEDVAGEVEAARLERLLADWGEPPSGTEAPVEPHPSRWTQGAPTLDRLMTGDEETWRKLAEHTGSDPSQVIETTAADAGVALTKAIRSGDQAAWLAFAHALTNAKASQTQEAASSSGDRPQQSEDHAARRSLPRRYGGSLEIPLNEPRQPADEHPDSRADKERPARKK